MRAAILLLGLGLCSSTTHAEIYRWTDASGTVHFSDTPNGGKRSAALPAPVAAPAPLRVPQSTANTKVTVEHYEASPATPRDFSRAFFAATPIQVEGKPYLGQTHWHVYWDYKTQPVGSLCRVQSVSTRTEIRYIMPRLGNEATLPVDTVRRFRDYYSHLLVHEEGHGDSGRQAADDIRSALTQLAPQARCEDLGPLVERTAQGVIARYSQRDKDYDLSTQHGRSQGADIRNYQ